MFQNNNIFNISMSNKIILINLFKKINKYYKIIKFLNKINK